MENVILTIDWYIKPPIDFEHKQYVLFDYLQKVDKSFMEKKLSPYFLNLEKLLIELNNFNLSYQELLKKFDREKYLYFENEKLDGCDNELVKEIKEIVDFSIPQLNTRLEFGKTILTRNKQILY
jgi:hypothetical protein